MISVKVRCLNCNDHFANAPTACPVCSRADMWEPCVVDDAPAVDVERRFRHHSGVAFFAYDEAAKVGAEPPAWAAAAIPANSGANRAQQLDTRLAQAIDANSVYLARTTSTTAQNTAQLKSLTRQVQALLRKAQGRFDGID